MTLKPHISDEFILHRARVMREKGLSWDVIVKQLHVGEYWLRVRLDPSYKDRKKSKSTRPRRSRPARDPRIKYNPILPPPDTRDLTARLLGDPLPGRRAIDGWKPCGENLSE